MDVSDSFYFSARGRGRGSPRGAEKGEDDLLLESPRRGGGSPGCVGGGGEGPGGCLQGISGRGAKYLFSGPIDPPRLIPAQKFRSEKLHNESFPNFSNFRPEFCPEFCSEFCPNFSRIFRASFRGRRRTKQIHQKSLPFFNAKFPGKHEKNIHKILLESRQSNKSLKMSGRALSRITSVIISARTVIIFGPK